MVRASSGALHPSNPWIWKNFSNENSCVRFVRSLMCTGWNWICRDESIQLFSSLFDTIIVLFTPQGIFYTNRGAQWKERKETKSCETFLAFSCDATFFKSCFDREKDQDWYECLNIEVVGSSLGNKTKRRREKCFCRILEAFEFWQVMQERVAEDNKTRKSNAKELPKSWKIE